jgi:hypothetical protein
MVLFFCTAYPQFVNILPRRLKYTVPQIRPYEASVLLHRIQ